MISVPTLNSRHVTAFCRKIRADSSPLLVVVQPAVDARRLDCSANVRRVVDRSGGRILYGWAIWEWPKIYIEAEHHAIYEDQTGALFDVTPPLISGVGHTLFLPDDSAVYDFDNEGIRRHNHRMALKRDPLIKALFENKREYDELQNSIPGVGMVSTNHEIAIRLCKIRDDNIFISNSIAKKYTGRNDSCFCGSGKKFKRCHYRSE